MPALSVLANTQAGPVHYIVLQLDKDPQQGGPTIRFNEGNLCGGSIVSGHGKEGLAQAVAAVTKAVGEDGHEWVITIKNRSYNALTEGDVALTGQIMPNDRIEAAGRRTAYNRTGVSRPTLHG